MLDVILDTVIDALKLLPFLFITYLLMEYIESKASDGFNETISKAGYLGPFIGGILGAFPQCGFSAAAANLYAGRVITAGTLIAIFLSTSDEMLPIFLSEQVNFRVIAVILGLKIVIGTIWGFIIDIFFRKKKGDIAAELAAIPAVGVQNLIVKLIGVAIAGATLWFYFNSLNIFYG